MSSVVCFYRVEIEVKNEQAAKDALKRLGMDEKALVKRGQRYFVEGINSQRETEFRVEYGRAFAIREAKRALFRLESERLVDGQLILTFNNE